MHLLLFLFIIYVFMSKKILISSIVYYPEFVGGAEVAVKEVTDRLKDYTFNMITLLGSSDKRFEKINNIEVYRVGFKVNLKTKIGKVLFNIQKYIFPLMFLFKGSYLMSKNNYDIAWSIMANYAGFGALFLKLRFKKIKLFLTLQEGDPIPYIKRRVFLVYPIFKMIFNRADYIQPISKYLGNFAKSMNGKNIEVVPNGVDLNNFVNNFSEEQKNKLREELKIKKDDVVLVTTSRLVIKNGIQDVIKTIPLLPEKYKFLIIGEGYLRSKLEKMAADLMVSERVIFKGFIPQKEIPKYFSVSDIFIRTSLSEGLGNSFLEAMAFGLPVIATPVGGILDFIDNNITGVLVDPENVESIKNGILFLESKNVFEKISHSGQKLVYQKYNWDIVVNSFNKIFQNI